MTAVHVEAAAGGWSELTLAEQLANVGSEVTRTIRADRAGRRDRRDRALDRALELFDLSATDARWRGSTRREILRAREEFCGLFFAPDPSKEAPEALERYFLQFAVRARSIGSEPRVAV